MQMNERCREIRSLFDQFLDGDLPEPQGALLEQHLESCPDCRFELEKEREIIGMFDNLPEFRCPEHVVRKIEAAIPAQEEKIRLVSRLKDMFSPLRWRLVPIAAAAAMIIFIFFLRPGGEQNGPVAVQYRPEEIQNARDTAKWSLVLATQTISRAENQAVEEAVLDKLPRTLKKSIENSVEFF